MIENYCHRQRAPLCLILYGMALVSGLIALFLGDRAEISLTLLPALILILFALAFHYLEVVGQQESLLIRFGPLPLFRRNVPYAEIVKVEVGRTLFLDGWGIHMSMRGGWVWNLWGRDCVVVHLKKSLLRIGTNDAANLARFLETKITPAT